MFTIEVGKKTKDEEFNFEDLEMFHQECRGGKIKQKLDDHAGTLWAFTCQRCKDSRIMPAYNAAEVIQTAIDGRKRKFEHPRFHEVDIVVVQRV